MAGGWDGRYISGYICAVHVWPRVSRGRNPRILKPNPAKGRSPAECAEIISCRRPGSLSYCLQPNLGPALHQALTQGARCYGPAAHVTNRAPRRVTHPGHCGHGRAAASWVQPGVWRPGINVYLIRGARGGLRWRRAAFNHRIPPLHPGNGRSFGPTTHRPMTNTHLFVL